jgi:hypothetical protein
MMQVELPENYNRFAEALMIQEGACNPSGIARALVLACKQCLKDGDDQRTDPAVRLIVHQLAHLTNNHELDACTSRSIDAYGLLTDQCKERATLKEGDSKSCV